MSPSVDGPATLLAIGDMHGNLFAWERIVQDVARHQPNVIVQVGDFGYGWNEDYLPRLDEILEDANVSELFWLDGNHENFDLLEAVGAFPDEVEPCQTSERTWYLPRGYSWEIAGRRCMAVGGAYSVDKPWRTPHKSWWPQEELTDADVFMAKVAGRVDVLFTHDTFSGFRVPGIHAEWKQDDFEQECKPNRDKLLEIVRSARPSLYTHGHYHVGYEAVDKRASGDIRMLGLDREGQPGSRALIEFPSLETFIL